MEPGIQARFFVGEGSAPIENPMDTIELPAEDSYEHLPEKVLAFFQFALSHFDFDWLFKCDDDTFVAIDRLKSLIDPNFDLIGDIGILHRNHPHGGAGYFLSRKIVEEIVKNKTLSPTGNETAIISQAAMQSGAKVKYTPHLYARSDVFPRKDNLLATSHKCLPLRMKAINNIYRNSPDFYLQGKHSQWHDTINFYNSGFFARSSTNCSGLWNVDHQGVLMLKWFDWAEDYLEKSGDQYSSKYSDLVLQIPLTEKKAAGENDSKELAYPENLSGWKHPDLPRTLRLQNSSPFFSHTKCCVITFSRKRLNFVCNLINCMKTQTEGDFFHLIHLFDYEKEEVNFIKQVINDDSRFQIECLENLSQKENFLRVLSAVRGQFPYYLKLDDDDFYGPNFLKTTLAQARGYDMTACRSVLVYDTQMKTHYLEKYHHIFGNNMCFSHRAKDFILQNKAYSRFMYEDAFAHNLLQDAGFGQNIYTVPFPQIIYIRHGANAT